MDPIELVLIWSPRERIPQASNESNVFRDIIWYLPKINRALTDGVTAQKLAAPIEMQANVMKIEATIGNLHTPITAQVFECYFEFSVLISTDWCVLMLRDGFECPGGIRGA